MCALVCSQPTQAAFCFDDADMQLIHHEDSDPLTDNTRHIRASSLSLRHNHQHNIAIPASSSDESQSDDSADAQDVDFLLLSLEKLSYAAVLARKTGLLVQPGTDRLAGSSKSRQYSPVVAAPPAAAAAASKDLDHASVMLGVSEDTDQSSTSSSQKQQREKARNKDLSKKRGTRAARINSK